MPVAATIANGRRARAVVAARRVHLWFTDGEKYSPESEIPLLGYLASTHKVGVWGAFFLGYASK